jgi:hypothetical protein
VDILGMGNPDQDIPPGPLPPGRYNQWNTWVDLVGAGINAWSTNRTPYDDSTNENGAVELRDVLKQ